MRRLIGFLGSIGIGLLLAAAGLALDVGTLFYSGLAILALMVALWIWAWARPAVAVTPIRLPPLPAEDEPTIGPLSDKQRALISLRKARESAIVAKSYKSNEGARRAYHELQAALLSVKREFGIGMLKLTSKNGGTIPYTHLMDCYIAYVDRIYPLLREGHVEEAEKESNAFKWSWGED